MRRGLVASLSVLAIGLAAVALVPSARSGGMNLVGNPGFEAGTDGWSVGPGYAISATAGGHAGTSAGMVAATSPRRGACTVSDDPAWVASSEPGTYTASVWIRNDRGGAAVSIRIAETDGSRSLGSTQAAATLTTEWQRLQVEYRVERAGTSLDLTIASDRKPRKGDACLLLDDAMLVLDATTPPPPAPSPTGSTSTQAPTPSDTVATSTATSAPTATSTSTSTAPATSTSTSSTATHTHEPSPTSSTTSPPPTGAPDPLACTGYPEPRIFYETQSWWEPVPGIGGQGHVHLGMCWPHQQVVSGTVRLDLVTILHGNKGTITRFKVQDDFSRDYNDYVSIPVDTSTGGDTTVIHTMWIDTTLQPDGLRQWRINTFFEHANGNSQRPKAMYQVQVENVPGTSDDVGPNYREYAGAGWYKEVDGTDWGYQAALIKPASHLAIGACVHGTWSPVVDTDASGTTEHMVTVDPKFHSGNQGWILHASASEGYEGPVPVDTTQLTDGWHRLVVQSAKRVGDEENGGVFVLPFRVCNGG